MSEELKRFQKGMSRKGWSLRPSLLKEIDEKCSCDVAIGAELVEKFEAMVKKGSRDLKAQDELLYTNIFDVHGNYIFHQQCVMRLFKVGNHRLSKLRKQKRQRPEGFQYQHKLTYLTECNTPTRT